MAPAHALEYTIDEPEDYLFGRPTSEDAPYTAENPNVDRSKNTALIPPGFGTPTSYLPNSGEYLTPNLVPGALSGGLVNQAGSVGGGTVTNSGYSTLFPPPIIIILKKHKINTLCFSICTNNYYLNLISKSIHC